ncbi:histidinol-phosphate transaminase [Pseudonocardia sp. HH130630-07]|uniref:histidinol-phosphate transaminase n=1 Tax=Pseudonocardia sp. HH130630-07 TaxID=1690815 RepID=UPI0008150C16|nr:histidinol-phosphate transaminase [Pseudonocardia sp. HH130630-07]ANY06578.1 aminotransferase [Pseudonocardia sp. HH130630-07]
MTLIRPDLDTLPAYVPGRTVPGAIKLASNEVAEPPAQPVLDAIGRAAAGGNRYPDLGVVELTARIADLHGLAPERIAVGCGSVTLCQQLVQVTSPGPGSEVLFAWRSFEAYPIVTQIGGAAIRTVPLDAGHRHDLDAMAAAITERTRLVFVCSPNNPTGPVVRREEFLRFLAAVPRDVLVVLDEAYAEYVTDDDAVHGRPLLDEHPNLVVLRTFSKAYRMAGLRVGYALASEQVATALRKVAPPFGVNSLAQAGAIAALEHREEILAGCADVVRERERVAAELRGLGLAVPPSEANFVWLPLGGRSADFAAHCAGQKVIVRPFPPDGVRVTVSTPEENDRLLAAAAGFDAAGSDDGQPSS